MEFPSLPRKGRTRPALLILPGVLVLAAVAGACGGSARSSASTTTTTATGTGSFAAARARFTSCMEAHGVPASEATRPFGPRRGSTGTSSGAAGSSTSSTPPTTTAAFGAAFAACRSDLPNGFGRGSFQNTAAGRAYLQCLQLHGVTFPSASSTAGPGSANSPTTGGTGPGLGARTDNPAFQKARAACAALAPNRAGTGSASTSTVPGGA